LTVDIFRTALYGKLEGISVPLENQIIKFIQDDKGENIVFAKLDKMVTFFEQIPAITK
jgi:hypothetical protein